LQSRSHVAATARHGQRSFFGSVTLFDARCCPTGPKRGSDGWA